MICMPRLLLVAFVSVVSACGKWPPYHEDLTERFNDNREAFEQLEAKILDTHYVRVSVSGPVGTNRVRLTWKVNGSEGKDHIYDQEYIEDAEWHVLLSQAQVWSVTNYDGTVSFDFGSSVDSNNKDVYADYTHSRERLESRKPCLPDHRKIPCGLCAVVLDDEWYIEYWWYPEELVLGGFEQVLDDEMTEEQYDELYDRNLEQCRVDGLTAIGYDPDDLQEDESEQD